MLISIFNSCGQLFGFLGSMLMAAITTTNVDIEDFDSVYRQKRAIFFWIAGFAGMGFLAIVKAYVIRPDEWVKGGTRGLEE